MDEALSVEGKTGSQAVRHQSDPRRRAALDFLRDDAGKRQSAPIDAARHAVALVGAAGGQLAGPFRVVPS
jgi:hypothetical protein